MLGTLPPLRGLSGYCLELALAMADAVPVEFISFKKLYPAFAYPGGGLKDDYTFPPVEHADLKVSRLLTWYNPGGWAKAGLFNTAPLLHAQWWSLPLFPVYLMICGAFKVRGKPVVFTVHNTGSHEHSSLYRKVSSLVFRLGDHFIVHTSLNKEQLVADYGINAARISLIPHGTLDFNVKTNGNRESIRSAMGFKPDHKVILLFGAIRSYKGIETALRAFGRVQRQMPQARLLIAGKLWESWAPYSRLIDELDIRQAVSTCLDYIPSDEVYKYYTASDMVILPYHHFDSQSGAGAGALSFRKPLIVTRVGGLPDLVEDPHFVVPPNDPTALANVLVESLTIPGRLDDMAAAAERVALKLAWPAIVLKTMTVYRKVLGNTDALSEA